MKALQKRYAGKTGRHRVLEKRYGRPPMIEGTAKTSVFSMKMSEEDRSAIDAAAKRAGVPVTQWAREALIAAAGED